MAAGSAIAMPEGNCSLKSVLPMRGTNEVAVFPAGRVVGVLVLPLQVGYPPTCRTDCLLCFHSFTRHARIRLTLNISSGAMRRPLYAVVKPRLHWLETASHRESI